MTAAEARLREMSSAAENGQPIPSVKNIRRDFAGVIALRDVSFDLRRGAPR